MLICNVCGAVKIVKPWKPLKIGMDLHAFSGLFLSGICGLLLRILAVRRLQPVDPDHCKVNCMWVPSWLLVRRVLG